MEAKLNTAGSSGSNYNPKFAGNYTGTERSLSLRTISSEVVESDFKSEYNPTIENREEECTRPPTDERCLTSSSASEFLIADTRRPRGRPRKDSGGPPTASPTTGTHKYIRFAQSSPMRPRRGRPSRTVSQSALLAAKRIKRDVAHQNYFSPQKSSFGTSEASKAEEQETVDESSVKSKHRAPSAAPRDRSRTPQHKPLTADSADSLDNSLHAASSVARRRIRKHSGVSCENGAAESASSLAYPLLPGATALTGGRFLTAQSIFDILSEPTMRERAVSAIPTGPKVNCYFLLNIGAELTDYEKYLDNRQRIHDKLRDDIGSRGLPISRSNCLTLSDSGVLKYIDLNKNKNSLLDLRMYSYYFRNSEQLHCDQIATLRVCWFFNAERSPAPGFIVVMYLEATHNVRPDEHSRKAMAPTTSLTNKMNEKAVNRFEVKETETKDENCDESAPATKRRWHFIAFAHTQHT